MIGRFGIADPVKFAARVGAVACIVMMCLFLGYGLDLYRESADTAGTGAVVLALLWLWFAVRLATFRLHDTRNY